MTREDWDPIFDVLAAAEFGHLAANLRLQGRYEEDPVGGIGDHLRMVRSEAVRRHYGIWRRRAI